MTGSFPERAGELGGPFDAVTMNQFIEHMTDPVGALKAVRELLKPGGTLVLWTPFCDGAAARLFGSSWYALEQPRHYVLFTRRHLAHAAPKAGLRLVAAWDLSSTSTWTRSLAYRLSAGRWGKWAKGLDEKRWIHHLLFLPTLALDLLGFGDGGVAVLVRDD